MLHPRLEEKIARLRRTSGVVAATEGALNLLAACACAVLATYLLSVTTKLGPNARTLVVAACGAALFVLLVLAVIRALRAPPDPRAAALMVERANPSLGERLLSAVELTSAPGPPLASPAMVDALEWEVVTLTEPLEFEQAVPRRGLVRRLAAAAIPWVAVAILALATPGSMARWWALYSHPRADGSTFSLIRLRVSPGNCEVERGSPLAIAVTASGPAPAAATFSYRLAHDDARSVSVGSAGRGRFRYVIPSVTAAGTYTVRCGDAERGPYSIRVLDRPRLLGITAQYRYPAYTRLKPHTDANGGGVLSAPVGTAVLVTASTDQPLKAARIAIGRDPSSPMVVDGPAARAEFVIRASDTYSVQLRGRDGLELRRPAVRTINAIPDRPPAVFLRKPGRDRSVGPHSKVPILAEAQDDYGVTTLWLRHRLGSSGVSATSGLRVSHISAERAFGYLVWDLTPLRLKEGDTVIYQAVARDNDAVTGPKEGASQEYRLTVVSDAELRWQLTQDLDDAVRDLLALLGRQRAARAQVEAGRAAAPGSQARGSRLSDASDQQRSLPAAAASAAERVANLARDMAYNGLAMPEDTRTMANAVEALRRMQSEQMPAAAERIDAGRQSANPASANAALGQAIQQQKQVEQSLQRIANQMGLMQRTQQAGQQAADLLRRQRETSRATSALARRPSNAPEDGAADRRDEAERLAQEQDALRRETRALGSTLSNLSRQTQQSGMEWDSRAQQASEALSRGRVPQRMASAAQSLEQGAPSDAASAQRQAEVGLAQSVQALQGDQLPSAAAQANAAQTEAARAASQAASLARRQREVLQRTARAAQGDQSSQRQEAGRIAPSQRNLRSEAQRLADALSRAGLPASNDVGEAVSNMREAEGHLSAGDPESAVPGESDALQALLRAQAGLQQTGQQRTGAGQVAARPGQSTQRGQKRGVTPLPASLDMTGEVLHGRLGALGNSAGWGKLPPHLQKALREANDEGLPEQYRDLLKAYYRALSEGRVSGGGR